MKNQILISIVIPSYNRANTVAETIESIINQQVNAEIEIVIGDDCSTDNAREVLLQYQEKYPNVIRLFFWAENMGLGANWASCIKECRGKYICNCDNDDYWHNPNKLQLQLDYMEKNENSNVLITNHRCHNRNTGTITEGVVYINKKQTLQDAIWTGNSSFCNATVMYRSDFLKRYVDLEEFINRRLSLQDWPAWVILAAYTDFDILPVSTATFGIETVSITRPDTYERLEKRYQKDIKVYEYLCELFPTKFNYSVDEWMGGVYKKLMALAYRKNDFYAAHRYAKLSYGYSLKRICAKNKISFWLFIRLRDISHMIKCH